MNNQSNKLRGVLAVAFLAFAVLPFAMYAQGGGGQQLPKCPEEAQQVGGANMSSSNAAAGSNASCKKGQQEGFFSGQPYQWKCSKNGQTMSNKLDAPCDYSGQGQKIQGKCSADGECKASNPEGKPPEMPKPPQGGGGGEKPQQQPQQNQSTSTASTTPSLFDRNGTTTEGISSDRDDASTSTDTFHGEDFAADVAFQTQDESSSGAVRQSNWTGVNNWNGWIGSAGTVSGDENGAGAAGLPGSPGQARGYGSTQFQQSAALNQWRSLFNESSDRFRNNDQWSPSSASAQLPPSGGMARGEDLSQFRQYGANASFEVDVPGAYAAAQGSSGVSRAYYWIVNTARNLLGL